jgi:hypothetical protein
MKDRAIRYILERLAESSTLRGIVLAIASAFGYELADTKVIAIICVGNLIAGVIGAALPDKLDA